MTVRRAVVPVAALAVAVGSTLAACGRSAEPRPGSAAPAAAPATTRAQPRPPAGRPAVPADAAWITAARARMHEPRESACGPYRLLSDSADARLLGLCRRIGERLDEVYAARFGIRPVGQARGAVLLFTRREDFRRFAGEVAQLPAGYVGFSRAARGVVALPADDERFATTLAHELTHLVNRRALGPDLAPWLAEGLADAIGDAVGETGLTELDGLRGIEPQAGRLARALAGEQPPSLWRLARLDRDEFDRAIPSFDYELSALAIRLLLTDGELAPGFRRFLADLAAGVPYAAERLPRALGVGWEELDRRLRVWLKHELSLA